MGLDVLNEKAVHDEIVHPAIEQLEQAAVQRIIPAGQKALDETIDRTIAEAGAVIGGYILSLQAITDKLVKDAGNLLAAQDGWTLTVTIPETPITIRLTKPKEQA